VGVKEKHGVGGYRAQGIYNTPAAWDHPCVGGGELKTREKTEIEGLIDERNADKNNM